MSASKSRAVLRACVCVRVCVLTGGGGYSLANWTTPIITQLACVALLVGALVLYVVPVNYLLLVAITRKFIKKGLAHYKPFGFFTVSRDHKPVNEVLEIINRVPSDIDLVRRKRLPPKSVEKRTRAAMRSKSALSASSA